MSAVFVVCLLAGLLLAVHVMLHGLERRVPVAAASAATLRADALAARAPHERSAAHDPRAEPSPWLNGQNAAALLVLFGAVGYGCWRAEVFGPGATVGVALAAGVAGAAGSAVLVARWALPGARGDSGHGEHELQGHPAAVTGAIGAGGTGEIAYEAEGRTWRAPARSWDGAPIDAGAEVVIERLDGGVAVVERWAEVEARL